MRVVERVPVRRRSRTSGTRRGRRARLPPTRFSTTAPQAPRPEAGHRAPIEAAALGEQGVGTTLSGRRAKRGEHRVGTTLSGWRAKRGERERARRPSRVARRASPTVACPAGCPRAMPRRDPQAGDCALRARRRASSAVRGRARHFRAPSAQTRLACGPRQSAALPGAERADALRPVSELRWGGLCRRQAHAPERPSRPGRINTRPSLEGPAPPRHVQPYAL